MLARVSSAEITEWIASYVLDNQDAKAAADNAKSK